MTGSNKKEAVRLNRLAIVEQLIRNAENPDIDKLIMFCCSEWGVAKRTAQEYIKIVQYRISLSSKGEKEGRA